MLRGRVHFVRLFRGNIEPLTRSGPAVRRSPWGNIKSAAILHSKIGIVRLFSGPKPLFAYLAGFCPPI